MMALLLPGEIILMGNSSSVKDQINSEVRDIFSTDEAFAALKNDGSVVVWGNNLSGGDSSSVSSQLSSDVSQIFSTDYAFAALKNDGSVVTWGDAGSGGDSSSVSSSLGSGVSQIYSANHAFAALKNDGSVVTWGDNSYGGNSTSVKDQINSEVRDIFSTAGAFAALKNDDSVITWGSQNFGGDSIDISSKLISGVKEIFSNDGAFAALKNDGSVVTWGTPPTGGDSGEVRNDLNSGVIKIFSNRNAFAALKNDGSVVTWGDNSYGGNSSSVKDQINSEVRDIFSTDEAFAALKNDGSVVTWGYNISGGDSSNVSSQLNTGVSFNWQTSSDGINWNKVSTASSYLIASSEEGKSIKAVISYKDDQGFDETVTTSSSAIPYVDDGDATFSINGTAAVGNTLSINEDSADPDGTGTLSYSWQTSSDGNNWNEVSTSSSYLVASSEEGKSIKAVISYKDEQGFDEIVTTPISGVGRYNSITGTVKYWQEDKLVKDLNVEASYSKINVSENGEVNFRDIIRDKENGTLSASLWVDSDLSNFENINFSFDKNNDTKFEITPNTEFLNDDWLKQINDTDTELFFISN